MTTAKHHQLLGAHMSIKGGLHNAFYEAQSVNATAVQFFSKSNRQWQAKPIAPEAADLFIQTRKDLGFSRSAVAIHACYLINLCAEDESTRKQSIKALAEELQRCAQLEVPTLIIHPGSRGKQELSAALQRVGLSLNEAINQAEVSTKVLIEMMAGQGSVVGVTLEEVAGMVEPVQLQQQVGVCVDTCHIFAAGYDLTTMEGFAHFWKEFESKIGLNKLGALHINNSKQPLGSRIDRHEQLDEGKIDLLMFKLLLNDMRFIDIPKFLETYKSADLHEDRHNLKILIDLIEPRNITTVENTPLAAYLKK